MREELAEAQAALSPPPSLPPTGPSPTGEPEPEGWRQSWNENWAALFRPLVAMVSDAGPPAPRPETADAVIDHLKGELAATREQIEGNLGVGGGAPPPAVEDRPDPVAPAGAADGVAAGHLAELDADDGTRWQP